MGTLLKKINSRKLTYTSPLKTHLHLLFHAESHTLPFCIAHNLPEAPTDYFNALQKVMRVSRIKACPPVQFAPLCVHKQVSGI